MQSTNIADGPVVSEGREQVAHSTHETALPGSVDISVLRDVTGCKKSSDAFLEHIVRQHKGNLEVRTTIL